MLCEWEGVTNISRCNPKLAAKVEMYFKAKQRFAYAGKNQTGLL